MIETESPGFLASMAFWSSAPVVIALPSTAVMTSPPVGKLWPSTVAEPDAALEPRIGRGPALAHVGHLDADRHAELFGDGVGDRGDAHAEVGVLDGAVRR